MPSKKKMKAIIKDYSEISTIAGFVYIFMQDQRVLGVLFWTFVIAGLSILGLSWSITAYQDWDSYPVLTTASTTGLPIHDIEFPSVILCAQGVIDNVMMAGLLRQYYDYYKATTNKTCFSLNPYDTSAIWTKPVTFSYIKNGFHVKLGGYPDLDLVKSYMCIRS